MKNQKLPLNLQLFAEDVNESGNEGNGGSENNGAAEKTFTQSQVNGMMAKEKNEGKRSILKSLGFENEEDALAAVKEFNEYKDSKKTEDQKNKEDLENAKSELGKANARASAAEDKLSCLINGVDKDSIDDVLAIAKTKVTEDKDLDKVISEMKSDKRYSTFFGVSSNNGTGSNLGHSANPGSDNNDENNGKRLAEMRMNNSKERKNSYFN